VNGEGVPVNEEGARVNGGDDIRRLDEVLELLYWLEGEGFAADTSLAQMARFLTYPEAEVADIIHRLCVRGDVTAHGEGGERFVLTAIGKREAGRRFQDTFQELLSQGHGECSDPNCDCMDDPAACRHRNHNHVHEGSV
jgi:hypothetical protein